MRTPQDQPAFLPLRRRGSRSGVLGTLALVAVLALAGRDQAQAAAPTFANVCTGLGVALPSVPAVASVTDPLLGALLSPLLPDINQAVTNVTSTLQSSLSGKQLAIGVLDAATHTFVSTAANNCYVAATGLAVDNNLGLSFGGGQILGLGGTGSAAATAGDLTAIAFGNGATTLTGAANAIALGTGATVSVANSLALGGASAATRGAVAAYTAFGLTGNQASTGEVSIGSSGNLRQLTNLAAGSAASDAATVGQVQGAAGAIGSSLATALGAGAAYNAATGLLGNPTFTIGGLTYSSIGGAITALKTAVSIEPLQYSTLLAPLTANPGVVSNSVTLVGTLPGVAVALHNVAAGSLAAGSSDAVDGAQIAASATALATTLGGGALYNPITGTITAPLYTIQGLGYGTVGAAFGAIDTTLTKLETGKVGAFVADNTTNLAASVASGVNATAGGFGASASGLASTVVGTGASDNGSANSTVIGTGAHVVATLAGSNAAIGQGAVATVGALTNYTAFGLAAAQTSAGETSFGSVLDPHQLTNVAAGHLATDAVNVAQLQGVSNTIGSVLATSLGAGAVYNAATGSIAAPLFTVAGTTFTNVGAAIAALSTSVAVTPLQYSTLLAPLTANPGVVSDSVTLVGTLPGTAVALHNLAAGSLAVGSTDAVDGAQIAASGLNLAATLGGGALYNPLTGTITAPLYTIQGIAYSSVGSAFTALNGTLSNIETGKIGAFVADNTLNLVTATASGLNASAGGFGASATGAASTVLGNNASDGGTSLSTAIGTGAHIATALTGSNTAIGAAAAATVGGLTNYAAFGLAAAQTSAGEVSVGSAAALHQVTNVAAGSALNDAVNVAQLEGAAAALASSIATSLGGSSVYNALTGQIAGTSYTVGSALYGSVGAAIAALNTSVASTPLQYSSLLTPTIADPGVISNDVTLVGSLPGAAVALHNVAAGSIAALSTDAVNGGQLNATTASLAALLGGGATVNPISGLLSAPSYTIAGTIYSTVGGALTALNSALNGGGGSIYVDVNSTLGAASATGSNAVALGSATNAAGTGSVAIGNGASAQGANSVAIGAGSSDGGQANVVSVGAVGAERRIVNVAAGTLSTTSTDAVNGSQLYQTNAQVASLAHSSVQYATNGAGQTLSSITLSSDAGGPVIIHNLAPGVAPTDAATVAQVQSAGANAVQYTTVAGVRSNTIALAGGQAGGVVISNVAAGVLGTDAANVSQVQAVASSGAAQANAYTDQRINNLQAYTDQQISQTRKQVSGGVALALAAGGLHYDDRPGKISIGGATAYYHNQMGIAFGIATTSEDGRLRLNAAVTASPTTGQADIGVVLGASIALN